MSKKCRLCGQNISDELIAKKKKLKGQRVRAALAKAKANGNPVGRPKEHTLEQINYARYLRRIGWSLRNISKKVNMSVWSVQNAIKEIP